MFLGAPWDVTIVVIVRVFSGMHSILHLFAANKYGIALVLRILTTHKRALFNLRARYVVY